jgi:hypothetical protein
MDNRIFLFGIICIAALLILGCTTQQKTTAEVQQPSAAVQKTTPVIGKIENVTVEEKGPVVVSAREWYSIARDEALKWRTDAKLIEVSGTNQKKDGSFYPLDGKTDTWLYSFVSILLDKKYILTIQNGSITKNETVSMAMTSALYENAPDVGAWKIDSYSTVNTINDIGGGKNYLINTPEPIVNYLLTFEAGNPGKVYWTISYNPQRLGQSLISVVDATTNTII